MTATLSIPTFVEPDAVRGPGPDGARGAGPDGARGAGPSAGEVPNQELALSDPSRTPDAGRDTAFAHDALPWLDDVYRFALSLTRDEADADDVVQETFLRAYRSWHTFIPGTDCRRWLFTICRNVFLRSRERQRPMVDIEDGELDAVAAGSVYSAAREKGYDDLYARLDLAPALRDALDQLAEPFRTAVMLVDVEDMTYESAAAVMNVPIGTVRSRLFRGRRLLQEMLLTVAEDLGFANPVAGAA